MGAPDGATPETAPVAEDESAWDELAVGERAELLRRAALAATALATTWSEQRSVAGLLEPVAFARTAFALASALEHPRSTFQRVGPEASAPAVRVFPLAPRDRVWASGVSVELHAGARVSAGASDRPATPPADDVVAALEQLAAGAPAPVAVEAALCTAETQVLAPLVSAGALTLGAPPERTEDPAPLFVLIAPGPWSMSDMRSAARHVASFLAVSAAGVLRRRRGVVLLLERAWLQREPFVEQIHTALERVTPTPDAPDEAAHARLKEALPGAERRHEQGGRAWSVCPDVRESELSGSPPPPGVLYQVTLDVQAASDAVRRKRLGAAAFLPRAAQVARDAGARDACIFVHDATETAHPDALRDAVDALGAPDVGVNAWPLLGRVLGARAVVAPRPTSRLVVRAGLGAKRAAPWLVDRARGDELASRWLSTAPLPTWSHALGIALEGLRG